MDFTIIGMRSLDIHHLKNSIEIFC